MITNNYRKWIGAQDMFGNRDYDSGYGAYLGLIDTSGAAITMALKHGNKNASYNFSLGSDSTKLVDCQLGSGTGDFDPDDYTLANNVTSSFGTTTYTFSYEVSDNKLKRTMTFTRQNTSNSSVTVRQIGVIKVIKKVSSSGNWGNVLIGEFNIEPVTFAAGETVTITVHFDDQE